MSNPYAPPSADTPTPDSQPESSPDRPPESAPQKPQQPQRRQQQSPPAGFSRPPHTRGDAQGHPTEAKPTPETIRETARLARQFGVWLIATVLVSTFSLPWRLATIVFVIGTLIWGVRILRASAQRKIIGGMSPMVVVGLVMAALIGVSAASSALLWQAEIGLENCMNTALTQSAQAACTQEYQQQVTDLTQRLLGGS